MDQFLETLPRPQRDKPDTGLFDCMMIKCDDGVLEGEPRIDGTRIGVRHVAARVIDTGQSPAYVADQLDISLSAVYEALSYYDANIDEIREYERTNEAAFDRVRASSLKPREPGR